MSVRQQGRHHEPVPEPLDPTTGPLRVSFLAAWPSSTRTAALLCRGSSPTSICRPYRHNGLRRLPGACAGRAARSPATLARLRADDHAVVGRRQPDARQVGHPPPADPGTDRGRRTFGYDVRPSVRRGGHATAMLAAALPIAAWLGTTQALLTCAETNTPSQRVAAFMTTGSAHVLNCSRAPACSMRRTSWSHTTRAEPEPEL